MEVLPTLPVQVAANLQLALANHWGIRALRPLQEPAIRAVLEDRDSLVVLPTGGGKSLCYQAPAVVRSGTTVVISPLISLMKDQVDGLRSSGVNAIRLDSSLSTEERIMSEKEILTGNVRLLFVSPERLIQSDLTSVLQQIDVNVFAIDEAHCISHWGHDFRPEYRQLRRLREMFPNVSVHAYTATATERVRQDIVEQLGLRNPEILVGSFDRPNLTYRVKSRRGDLTKQVMDVLSRHPREGGIMYCISRADVDSWSAKLAGMGVKAMPYHAGMTPTDRSRTQDAFLKEACDVVVATVAFGMGIDRSNVRFVLHMGMPKSIEHYQQETGRAGRDGLEAECVLLHSGADFFTWKSLVERANGDADPEHMAKSLKHLNEMERYCRSAVCRHQSLVNYFGQAFEKTNCGACDMCLGETTMVEDAQVVAQKIISCVARVTDSFGMGHIISILRGENVARVKDRSHDKLSTFGILKEYKTEDLRDWIYQLIGQGLLKQIDIQSSFGRPLPVIKMTQASLECLRGERQAKLLKPVEKKKSSKVTSSSATAGDDGWKDVDKDLFEKLRQLRRKLATEMAVPPYIVFTDATLRDLSRIKPTELNEMRNISGIGEKKLNDFGELFRTAIIEHISSNESV